MRATHALIEGKEYEIDTDYRTAIECQELINDPDIDDYEKSIGVVVMLFGEDCPITEEATQKASLFLRGGDAHGDEEAIIDVTQDWTLIYSAFRSQYGIDLDSVELHYSQFVDLLKGLKDQVLNDVAQIRTYDLSEIKDLKARKKVADAKQKVALRMRTSDQVSQSAFYNALKKK